MAVRQIGGALGIAALAAILPAQTSSQPAPYSHVVFFSCATAAVAGLLSLGLSPRRGRPKPDAAQAAVPAAVATEAVSGKGAEL
jgi:hypothetical protein